MLPNDFVWNSCFSTPDIMSISIYGVDFLSGEPTEQLSDLKALYRSRTFKLF